jgi:hypothetical protein
MAFSDYKNLAQVQQQFQIKYREEQFILVQSLEIAPTFLEDFNFCKEHLDWYASEAARCEIIIFPILREIYKKYSQHYALWLQKSFSYDENLTGTPDYLFTTKSPLGKTVLGIPLLVIIEAKRNDFEQGWGQCLAELIAAQKINQDSSRPVYGIVTDGNLWQFGKLCEDTFIKQRDNYTIDELGRLFGAIDFVLQSCKVV